MDRHIAQILALAFLGRASHGRFGNAAQATAVLELKQVRETVVAPRPAGHRGRGERAL